MMNKDIKKQIKVSTIKLTNLIQEDEPEVLPLKTFDPKATMKCNK